MNKKILSLVILFFSVLTVAMAQDDSKIQVKGQVVDGATKEPIAFANLGLLGTMAGTATDVDGQFELVIPNRYATYVVRITAVGYAAKEFKLYELKELKDATIVLEPVTYGIDNVDVTAESLVLQKLLENVVANIGKNYIPRAYNYEGYFEHGVTVGEQEPKVKEAIVKIYDADGYKRTDTEKTFQAVNYTFSEARRSPGMNATADDLMFFDDVLTADVVRNTRNVLDSQYVRDFKLTSKGVFAYEGDSVQIVAYECKRPTLSNSGVADVVKYSGEIYVDMNNFAVIKNVARLTSKAYNALGRNMLVGGDGPRNEVMMTISTNYKKVSSYYFLSGVSIEYSYLDGGQRVNGEMQYQTTKVKVNETEPVTGRVYFEEIPEDEDFWNRYTIYLEEEE